MKNIEENANKQETKGNDMKDIYQRPEEILQKLIRFDTTNPPGNEAACIAYIAELLASAGIESQQHARDPKRPNLTARLKGKGNASPLLLYGHVDVVEAGSGEWTEPPFSGNIVDGVLWGRGAVDMKGAIAMMICAMMKAKIENTPLPGDVILCVLSDEEVLGEYGSVYMVENHADLFKDVRFALGEGGGFSLYVSGKRFYPIEIAEKQKCGIRATIRGEAGHGSSYVTDGTMAKLGNMLTALNAKPLPIHITPALRGMLEGMAAQLPFPKNFMLKRLLNPMFTDKVLKLMGDVGRAFVPLFRHTVNATVVKGGGEINVVPDCVQVDMDVRILPGFGPDDVITELRDIIGNDIELEIIFYDPGLGNIDMTLFDDLCNIMRQMDGDGFPVPLLVPGCTDARVFNRLGIQSYGFMPMKLPEEFIFSKLLHSVNERVPVEALHFGTEALGRVIAEDRAG